MIALIARHTAAALLRSPQTWLVIALLAALFGFYFLQQLESYLELQSQLALQDHAPGLGGFLAARFMAPLTAVFFLVAPLFAMRSFSDDYRAHTYALWQSAPVSVTTLVMGKFLGVLGPLTVLLAMLFIMPMTMLLWVALDVGVILSGLLGLSLTAAACASAGLYCSTLTRNSLLAIVASLALLALLWMLGSVSLGNVDHAALRALSPEEHLSGFFQGYLQTADVLYFLLFIALFLTLSVIRLDALRHRGA